MKFVKVPETFTMPTAFDGTCIAVCELGSLAKLPVPPPYTSESMRARTLDDIVTPRPL